MLSQFSHLITPTEGKTDLHHLKLASTISKMKRKYLRLRPAAHQNQLFHRKFVVVIECCTTICRAKLDRSSVTYFPLCHPPTSINGAADPFRLLLDIVSGFQMWVIHGLERPSLGAVTWLHTGFPKDWINRLLGKRTAPLHR